MADNRGKEDVFIKLQISGQKRDINLIGEKRPRSGELGRNSIGTLELATRGSLPPGKCQSLKKKKG